MYVIKRLIPFMAMMMLSFLLIINSTLQAHAADESSLESFNSGISAVINAKNVSTQSAADMASTVRDSDEEDAQTESTRVMANVSSTLNMRSEASEDSEKVGKLYKDCGGTILERRDGWTKLQSGNVIGWAKDEYLLFGDEAEALAKDVGVLVAYMNGVTRVRSEADAGAAELGVLPKGEMTEVISIDDDGWVCIDYDDENGYVREDCVTFDFIIDTAESMQEIAERQAEEAAEAAAAAAAEAEANRHVNYGEYTTDTDSTILLAALIQCEAGGESYDGQLAVGAVIMNRVRSGGYPNTIHSVIYASGQFTPAANGKLNNLVSSGNISSSCMQAAKEAISGVSNIGDCTHFRRNNGRDGIVIGNHVFY